MLRELEKAAQLLQTPSSSVAGECRDFPEEDQQAVEALAASVKAASSAMDDVVKRRRTNEVYNNNFRTCRLKSSGTLYTPSRTVLML